MTARRQLAPVALKSSTEVVLPEIDEYVRQKEATFITPDIIAAVEQELVQDMQQFLRKKVRDVKEDEWRFNAKFNSSFM
jgi:hypothetical protein